MAPSWPSLREVLTTPLSRAELKEIDTVSIELFRRIEELEKMKTSLNVKAMDVARRQASTSLRNTSEENTHWNNTISFFNKNVFEGNDLEFDAIVSWNRMLRGVSAESDWMRVGEVNLNKVPLLSYKEIPAAIDDFKKMIVPQDEGGLWKASRVYQWLITIHPFIDANGRSARLAADFILMQHGFLPLVFPSPAATFVAITPSTPQVITPYQAFFRVKRAVERALEVLQLPEVATE